MMSELEPYVYEGEVLEGELIVPRPEPLPSREPKICPGCRYRYSLAVDGAWVSRYGCTSRSSLANHGYCGQLDAYVGVGDSYVG